METAQQRSEVSRLSGARHPLRQLAISLGVAYLASWIVGVSFGFLVESTTNWAHGAEWERATLSWFHARPLPSWLDQLMLAMPYFGTNLTILPAMLIICPILWKRFNQPVIAAHLLILSIGSLSLNPTMKHLLNRPRPDMYPLRGMWTWASYPSGHVILTPALYLTLSCMLYARYKWTWPFFVTALLVALTAYSRLYLQVHWPTDLVGGVLIGLTWFALTWAAFAKYRKRTGGQ